MEHGTLFKQRVDRNKAPGAVKQLLAQHVGMAAAENMDQSVRFHRIRDAAARLSDLFLLRFKNGVDQSLHNVVIL